MSTGPTTSDAIVLRVVDYRDKDAVVTLLTPGFGRVSALARGARGSRRRFAGALQTMARIEATLVPGRGNLWQLREAELRDARIGLAADLARMTAAARLIELIRDIVPEAQEDLRLFRSLDETLARLEIGSGDGIWVIALAGELKLLSRLGLGMSTDRCNACGRAVPDGKKVHFHPGRGGIVCTSCGGGPLLLTAQAARALRVLHNAPLAVVSGQPIGEREIEAIDRAVGRFVEFHLGRPFRLRSDRKTGRWE